MAIVSNSGTWIAFAPKAGLTTLLQYADAGDAHTYYYPLIKPHHRVVIVCRDPWLRAISIYHYNMLTMPYNKLYNEAISPLHKKRYNSLYDSVRTVYPQPSELPVDEERFLYWIDQVLPNTIYTDGHTMTQVSSWKLPTHVSWQCSDVEWWCLQDLNHHLLKLFGWVPKLQNRQAYHRKRALKYLELDGVRDAILKHYAEDFTAYETALQQQVLR